MDRPFDAYLHLGIVHFMLYPALMGGDGPVVDTAQTIAQDGFFNVLEITRVNDPVARTSLKRLAETAHLVLGFGAQPIILGGKLDLTAADPARRAAAVATVKAGVDQASELGIKLLALMDGPNTAPAPGTEDAALARLVDSLKQLCQHAARYGMWISLEQFDRAIDKKSLLGPVELCVRASAMVRAETPNFGLTLDLSHLPLLGETPEHAIGMARDHLIHAHVGNCVVRDKTHPQYGDQHPVFGDPAGENDVPELTRYLQALFRAGYFEKPLPTPMPVVTFEVRPMADQSPAAVLGNCQRTFQQAWVRA
ncbi:MAG: TIM barrel protein [Actinobacteria bacterium]|nr:TIM barrel protein [Actinomycetota bacterium]